jgi:hypothetical protein
MTTVRADYALTTIANSEVVIDETRLEVTETVQGTKIVLIETI